jgi:hypothetical protein
MRLPLFRLLSVVLFVLALPSRPGTLRAAEPFFKKGDVIALVGGEDMVVASEYGYVELLLIRALPDYRLRFRNLAWEGDTVFEQRRDLNFPTWEEQLDKIGATVVIAQFGQMESLAGKEKLPEFRAAYGKLLDRFSGGGKRRLLIFAPTPARPALTASISPEFVEDYSIACSQLAIEKGLDLLGMATAPIKGIPRDFASERLFTRDGIHSTEYNHYLSALGLVSWLQIYPKGSAGVTYEESKLIPLRQLIIAKNRLWFDYWRPQNWAFLAGDRTAQPSSRDHLDPSKRWFPPEREAFLPLIEAKEKEIDALAAQLATP